MSTVVRSGVRAECLRAGGPETLFIVPGLEGDPAELAALVSEFTGQQSVYALTPLLSDAEEQPVTSVERIAELMVPVVQELSQSGSYSLAGYSFGALIALELGHQMREAGRSVDALFLIDAIYDDRYWPRGIWLKAMTRRTARHLGQIAHMRPTKALEELQLRAGGLFQRLLRRGADGHDPVRRATNGTPMSNRAYRAMAGYRPRYYDGPLTLIAASEEWRFGCDTADIWSGYVGQLSVQRIDGDHLTILKKPQSVAAVARVIDHGLRLKRAEWTGFTPMAGFERPMLLTTMRWFSAARLAQALSEAGFAVSTCRPNGHPLDLVEGLTTVRRLRKLWPLRSIAAAIRAANPDLVICDDEPSLALLRRLHERVRTTDPDMAALLVRSLGNVEDWPSITSRTRLASEVRALNLAAPETAVIANADELHKWATEHDLPIVLKTDGSWGGRGVVVLRDVNDVRRVWQRMSRPPGLIRGLKRAVIDHELSALVMWRRRERPVVNAQRFCAGRDAFVTAASVDGKVQSLVCLEVIDASWVRGPASIVRIIDNPQMAETAQQLIRRFGLTGFSGFDFKVADNGDAQLLETNLRVTPTAHLLVEDDCAPDRTVGLFPFELSRRPDTSVDSDGILDIPVRAPRLVAHGVKLVELHDRPIPRALRRVTRRVNGTTDETTAT